MGIINLMPIKQEVEYQFSTIFEDIDKNIELKYIYPITHRYKNISLDYLKEKYTPLNRICEDEYDGFIVTGAPIEMYEYEKVDFWKEIDQFFKKNKLPTIYICWAAQGALYSKFGIEKHKLEKKLFGIYEHEVKAENPFIKNKFCAPHSRNTYNKKESIQESGLIIIGESEEAGVYICSTTDYKSIFISGHSEYQVERLKFEYERDKAEIPKNYFVQNNPDNEINFSWKNHRDEFYKNWIKFIGGIR
nr:homoserine O-succinyltransferase [uncultured Cetobacterium sp.]